MVIDITRLAAFVTILVTTTGSAQDVTDLCGELSGETLLTADQSPYRVTCDIVVPKGSTLRVDAGVTVLVTDDASIEIQGQIVALGEEAAPIIMLCEAGRWNGIDIDHGGDGDARDSRMRHVELSHATRLLEVDDTGDSAILVERCKFDRWSSLALAWDAANGLEVRECEFGLNTPPEEANAETINGYRAGALVERCTFGRRRGYKDVIDLGDSSWLGPVPTIRYNTFLGGEDDAIDFDGSAGWIIGNLVMNHWPLPGADPGANGGGITGQDSDTVVMNNIVVGCYHGIGYKNRGTPLIVNNLVIDCGIGVTLYQDDCSEAKPNAVLINNIIWNNRDPATEALRSVVLNGAWFPRYCQDTSTDQATADITYSIVEGGWPGEGNLDADPLLVAPENDDFSLGPDSPAIDAGFGGPFEKSGVDTQALLDAWSRDREGRPRIDLECIVDRGQGDVTYADIGPTELEAPGPCGDSPGKFIRGDSNADGAVDISDAIHILLVLFGGVSTDDCDDARDTNDDGMRDISDAVHLLNHLFESGAAPPAPYPGVGEDPTADGLGCERGS